MLEGGDVVDRFLGVLLGKAVPEFRDAAHRCEGAIDGNLGIARRRDQLIDDLAQVEAEPARVKPASPGVGPVGVGGRVVAGEADGREAPPEQMFRRGCADAQRGKQAMAD